MRGPTKYPYVVLAFFPREWRVPISRRDVVARRAVGLGAAGLTLTLLCTSFFGKYQSPGSGLTASDAVAIVLIALTLPFAVRALWRIWMSPFQFFPRDATSTDLLQRINDASRMHPDIGAELHDIAHKQGGLFEFQVRGAEFEPLNRWRTRDDLEGQSLDQILTRSSSRARRGLKSIQRGGEDGPSS